MATYEIVAVIRPDLDEDALGGAIGRIHQRITEHGGTVTTTERWGKRRLAYSIQKYRDGFYVLTIFTLEPGRVAPLRQTMGLHEDLLRFAVAVHHPAPVPAAAQPAAGAAAARPAASQSAASQSGSATPQPAASQPTSSPTTTPIPSSPNGGKRPPVVPPADRNV